LTKKFVMPLAIMQLAHLPRARVRVPPGWYLSWPFSMLNNVATFCSGRLDDIVFQDCSAVGDRAMFVSWARNMLTSIVASSVAMASISNN